MALSDIDRQAQWHVRASLCRNQCTEGGRVAVARGGAGNSGVGGSATSAQLHGPRRKQRAGAIDTRVDRTGHA